MNKFPLFYETKIFLMPFTMPCLHVVSSTDELNSIHIFNSFRIYYNVILPCSLRPVLPSCLFLWVSQLQSRMHFSFLPLVLNFPSILIILKIINMLFESRPETSYSWPFELNGNYMYHLHLQSVTVLILFLCVLFGSSLYTGIISLNSVNHCIELCSLWGTDLIFNDYLDGIRHWFSWF